MRDIPHATRKIAEAGATGGAITGALASEQDRTTIIEAADRADTGQRSRGMA